MYLKDLVKNLKVKDIACDSRKVKKNSLFICIRGQKHDGHKFVKQAVENGASVIVYEDDKYFNRSLYPGIKFIGVKDTRIALAILASNFYKMPEKKINSIGITGTNGKTTTSFLIEHIMNNAGLTSGVIGTICIKIGKKKYPTGNTTPSSLDIYQNLYKMAKSGLEYAIMEVSSHGLDQERVYGIPFKVAIFTNLTQDHLDYHKNLRNYFSAKFKLFKNLKKGSCAILNTDDKYSRKIIEKITVPVVTYGINNFAEVMARDLKLSSGASEFELVIGEKKYYVEFNLGGYFNIYNALASAACAYALKIKPDLIVKALNTAKPVRGRFEMINRGQDFEMVVDYAHTPDGLENLLKSAREVTSGRIITVFGCGGDRDKTKRPIMGKIAARLSNVCIVTSDNPRSEEPANIIKDIETGIKALAIEYEIQRSGARGISNSSATLRAAIQPCAKARVFLADNYKKIVNRREAIYEAVKLARTGDMVIIAGKGHETYQIFKDKIVHFDDAEVASEAVKNKIQKIKGKKWNR